MARVLIQHRVRNDANGNVIGTRYEKQGQVVLNISHFYRHYDEHGNKVARVSCGDIWSVKPVNNPNYDYVTV